MKLNNNYLLLLLSILPLSSCTDKEDSASGQEPVPVVLHVAGEGLMAGTKAGDASIVPFETLVFATTRDGIYTGLAGKYEWQKKGTVKADKTVSLADAAYYPETGDWIYLVAVSPEAGATVQDGTVNYQLTGQTDLLYAPQIKGNKWNGSRFAGNTLTGSKDTPLSYSHLLTRLVFKAVKKEADGLPVYIKSILVEKVKSTVGLPLSSGIATYSGSASLTLNLAAGSTPDGISVAGKDPVSIGYLLLPPLDMDATDGAADSPYRITIETSVGTYTNIPLEFGTPTKPLFQRGMSHDITLNIGDSELGIGSISVGEWTTIPQNGELDLTK